MISWSSDISYLQSSSVGRCSVVVLLICPACTVAMFISHLSFICFVAVCFWCIYTGIAYTFISASFSDIMRADISCFPGTILARLIATSFLRLDKYYTIFFLSPRALHILCILIGMQHPSEKCFLPTHIPKAPLKNSSCRSETEIDGPGTIQWICWVEKYLWCFRFDETLQNGSTCVSTRLSHCGGLICFQFIYDQHI